MFKLVHTLPNKVLLACSGGVDSMDALHWLERGDKLGGILHINHGTGKFADEAEELVNKVSQDMCIDLAIQRISTKPPDGESKEAWWRDQRYAFFRQQAQIEDMKVVTVHNLNDCAEEYLINSIVRGRKGIIPYENGPVIRPFRTWSKVDIYQYAEKNKLEWIEDPSNRDTKFLRNRIRHEILPQVIDINPGFLGMVRRIVEIEGLE